jgi:hypothetical protein
MKKDNLVIFIIGLLLLAGMLITILFGGERSRHGVGILFNGQPEQHSPGDRFQICPLKKPRLDLCQSQA